MRVLLPLKEFAAAKQRLAGVLSPTERSRLFQAMVEDVLFAISGHPEVDDVVICSSDPAAAWLACYYEVDFLPERAATGGLNGAVNAAVRQFAAAGLREVLVVHGDLPLLSGADISTLLAAHRAQPGAAGVGAAGVGAAVTIAPDRRRTGTNLMAWQPLDAFEAHYGRDSFQRHCAQAREAGAALTVCELPGGGCDIDEPEDLLLLLRQPPQGLARYTLSYLQDSGVSARLLAMHRGADNETRAPGDGADEAYDAGETYDQAR